MADEEKKPAQWAVTLLVGIGIALIGALVFSFGVTAVATISHWYGVIIIIMALFVLKWYANLLVNFMSYIFRKEGSDTP